MQSYLFKIPLQRKEPEIHFDACQVDQVVELSDPEFQLFKYSLLSEHDFLREYNREHAGSPAEGVRAGLLVLGRGSDDGVFVCTEGANYARYSALVPNARQILLLKEYPSLEDCGSEMAALVERSIQKAITVGLPERFHLPVSDLKNTSFLYDFNEDLFLAMLQNRPEVDSVELEGGEFVFTVSKEYLPAAKETLRVLPDEEFKIACAKHLLWCYGAGGEQADFSNCLFDRVNFSWMELNSAIFDGAVFRDCDLSDASLCFASLRTCTFLGCNCRSWTAEEADLRGAVFDQCNLNNAYMTHGNLTDTVFQDCRMDYASIRNALVRGMRLEDTGSGTLGMEGTTEDAEAWNTHHEQTTAMEEPQ